MSLGFVPLLLIPALPAAQPPAGSCAPAAEAQQQAPAAAAPTEGVQAAGSVELFQFGWRTYQQVLDADSMLHTQLFGAIRTYLESTTQARGAHAWGGGGAPLGRTALG